MKDYREDRIAGEMSLEVTWVPQCNECRFGSMGEDCEIYGKMPYEYREDLIKCPKREKL